LFYVDYNESELFTPFSELPWIVTNMELDDGPAPYWTI